MAYEHFYQYYDQLMNDVPYSDYCDLLKVYGTKDKKMLELGCGTGQILVNLIESGYMVSGLDISEEMLQIANNKLVERNLSTNLFIDDMSKINVSKQYHIIYSFLDSINYLSDFDSIRDTFKGVYNALEDEGLFIFDIHSFDFVNQFFNGYLYHEDFDDFTYLWNTYVEQDNNYSILYHDLSFFIHQTKNRYSRVDESHKQFIYPKTFYIELLTQCGFTIDNILYDFKDELSEETKKIIFICKKYKS